MITAYRFAAATLLALVSLASAAPTTGAAQRLSFAPCRLGTPNQVQSVGAECAWLTRPENPADTKGRSIRLRVARIAAISARKQTDPLFVLAGGPGMAASTMYVSAANAFARIRQQRDIILVDQRGTGSSNALNCAFDVDEANEIAEAEMYRRVIECRDVLAKNADLRYYTTSVAVADLDAVREALGATRINLYGVSYGTRVAQHYLRRFPDRTRSVILDGVVAPDAILPERIALDAEATLQNILSRCSKDIACFKAFGDPRVHYASVRSQLAKGPVSVSLADPRSGELSQFEFTNMHLLTVLRLQSYSAQQAALLPLALWQAATQNDYRALGAQASLVAQSLSDVLAVGMHNSVICAEDDSRLDGRQVDRAAMAATYIGTLQLDAIRRMCRDWPRGPVDRDLFTPLKSATPVLLLSGGADPVTPPKYAQRAMVALTNGRHLEIPAMGHGQLGAPCMDRLMAEFVRDLAPKTLDASCLQKIRPMAFFISSAGPAP